MKIGKAYILEVQNVLAKIYVGNFFFYFHLEKGMQKQQKKTWRRKGE